MRNMRNMVIAVAVVSAMLVLTVALAQDESRPVNAQINAHLRLADNGSGIDIRANVTGLLPNTDFTLRAYTSGVKDCGAAPAEALFATSNPNGYLTFRGTVSGVVVVVDDVGSVSIRRTGPPGENEPVICWQDTTP